MPKSRPDWVKCIRPAESRRALCGRICDPLEFTLLGIEHAIGCWSNESRIQACPMCLESSSMDLSELAQQIKEMMK